MPREPIRANVQAAFARVHALGLTDTQVVHLSRRYLGLPVAERHPRHGVSHNGRTHLDTPRGGIGVAGWILGLSDDERAAELAAPVGQIRIAKRIDEPDEERTAIRAESDHAERVLGATADYLRKRG